MVIRYENYVWVISERKQPGRKPVKFLIQKHPSEQYISSLFPEPRGWFRFDWKGVKYRVNLSDTVEIIGQNLFRLLLNNNKQLVSIYGYTPPETEPAPGQETDGTPSCNTSS